MSERTNPKMSFGHSLKTSKYVMKLRVSAGGLPSILSTYNTILQFEASLMGYLIFKMEQFFSSKLEFIETLILMYFKYKLNESGSICFYRKWKYAVQDFFVNF